MVEITSEEQNKVKRMKRTENSLRDLWDSIKHTNIQIIGIPHVPGGSDSKESAYNVGRPGLSPLVEKISWRRKWQPTPVFLPGKSHGQRSLVGYSPWGRKESDTTEQLHFHFQKKKRKRKGKRKIFKRL